RAGTRPDGGDSRITGSSANAASPSARSSVVSGQEPLGVGSIEHAEEFALRSRDEDRRDAFVLHPPDESAQFFAPLDGGGSKLHEVDDGSIVFCRQILGSYPSEHDAAFVHDDAERTRPKRVADIPCHAVGSAGGGYRLENLTRDVAERAFALHRQALFTPFRLAADHVEHAG